MTAAIPWGHGDVYTIIIALPIFVTGALVHWKSIFKPHHSDLLVSLMGSALTVGPLLMILVDPLIKTFTDWKIDLLSIVMNEGRITLWLAAFIALVSTTLSFFRPRDLPAWDGVERRKFQIPPPAKS